MLNPVTFLDENINIDIIRTSPLLYKNQSYFPVIFFTNEIWAPITDGMVKGIIENRYYISNFGNVYDYYKNKKVKSIVNPDSGYLVVNLRLKNKKGRYLYTHRLVALAFLYDPELNYSHVVNHINGVKTDPKVDNLEFCSQRQNSIHAINTGLKYNYGHSPFTDEQVHSICNLLQDGYTCKETSINIFGDESNTNRINYIKCGLSYTHISNEYNFPPRVYKNVFTQEQIQIIKNWLKNRKPNERYNDLLKILNLDKCDPTTKQKYITTISYIKNNKIKCYNN